MFPFLLRYCTSDINHVCLYMQMFLGRLLLLRLRMRGSKSICQEDVCWGKTWVASYVQMGNVSLIKKQLCCFGLDSSKQHTWMLREAILSNPFFPLLWTQPLTVWGGHHRGVYSKSCGWRGGISLETNLLQLCFFDNYFYLNGGKLQKQIQIHW